MVAKLIDSNATAKGETVTWKPLISSTLVELERGHLLKFRAEHPFEDKVVMMVCEEANSAGKGRSLITISGYKAGINCYVTFPRELMTKGLTREWLIENWTSWGVPGGDIETVHVRTNLSSKELL